MIEISLDDLKSIYYGFADESSDNHRNAQIRALFQYLIGTEYFTLSTKGDVLTVHHNWMGNLNHLKSLCNLQYLGLTYEESKEMFDNRTNRKQYSDVVTYNPNEIEIAKFSCGFICNESVDKAYESSIDSNKLVEDFRQYIYFGAPGTGKSYQLKQDSKMFPEQNIERVTFHPNMTYGQFVGTFKPFPYFFKGEERITYKYIPGVLMKMLVNALKNPLQPFLLIIEELNRANVSAVFGDIFQLLDRNADNTSEYPISINEDIRMYLEGHKEILEQLNQGLYFPKNFYIWTTMNSADQGVMPLDTAFKRRWEQKYFGVDQAFNENSKDFDKYAEIILYNGTIKWNDLRLFINSQLIKLKVPEDKLLGPYFISKNILEVADHETCEEANNRLTKSFKNKVLNYIFEDAGKSRRNQLFNLKPEKMMYSELLNEFDERGVQIFINHEEIEVKIKEEFE